MSIKKILGITSFIAIMFGQNNLDEISTFSNHQISSEKYKTDEKGNIAMYVNIWGQVRTPGRHLVYDGIDFATLISIVGGPAQGANMQKVRLYREVPDVDGTLTYDIDLESFISTGDRKNFLKIKPNDTILIPQKPMSLILQQVGTINTIFSLLNLYIAIESRYRN